MSFGKLFTGSHHGKTTPPFLRGGTLPEASVSPLTRALPNILSLYDAPGFVTLLAAVGAGVTIPSPLVGGIGSRPLSFGAIFACFLGRNPLTLNPSLPYIGWMLLAHAILPNAPFGAFPGQGRDRAVSVGAAANHRDRASPSLAQALAHQGPPRCNGVIAPKNCCIRVGPSSDATPPLLGHLSYYGCLNRIDGPDRDFRGLTRGQQGTRRVDAGATVKVLDFPSLDLPIPRGRDFLTMFSAIAQRERLWIVARTKKVRRIAVTIGVKISQPFKLTPAHLWRTDGSRRR